MIARMTKTSAAEIQSTKVGTIIVSAGLPEKWPSAEPFLFAEIALADGVLEIGSFTIGTIGARLIRWAGDDGLLIDEATSPIITRVMDAAVTISIQWSKARFSTFRINGVELLGNEVATIILDTPPSTDRGTDYSASNEKARNYRHRGLPQRPPNPNTVGGGQDFMLAALTDEVRQIEDLIGLLANGGEHHLPGLAARVRMMVHGGSGRKYGLLQHCAAYDSLPLTVFADRQPEARAPLDDALVFHLVGAGKADDVFCNPVDLDVWLKMPAITISGRPSSHFEVITEIGNTIGSHRDDGMRQLAHALQVVRSGDGPRYRDVQRYITEVATILLELSRYVLAQSKPTAPNA